MPVRFHLRPSIRRELYTGHMTLGTDVDPLLNDLLSMARKNGTPAPTYRKVTLECQQLSAQCTWEPDWGYTGLSSI